MSESDRENGNYNTKVTTVTYMYLATLTRGTLYLHNGALDFRINHQSILIFLQWPK